MPKHGFMTPKAISNRIKAKGLLKLRWYCQMCEKSCRDENGFKCHCMSEAHLRQMALYRENPNQFLSNYSREFENGFMSIVKIKGRSRVLANAVYQDYIRERHHTHMKATRWQSLAQFVQYLGKEGKIIAEETPKGWYITYIDRDPEVMARQRADERKERMKLDEVQRNERMIQKQMKQASGLALEEEEQKESVFQRTDESQKIVLSMKPAPAPTSVAASTSSSKNVFGDSQPSSKSTSGLKRKPSAVHELMMDITSKKRFQKQPELTKEPVEHVEHKHWITEGIVVKVLNRKLKDGALYKQKGEVLEVLDGGIARVRLLSGTHLTLRIAEKELESVLPAFGRPVMILRGSNIGRKALLRSIDERKFRAQVELVDGDEDRGKILSLDFEDISKLAS